MLNSKIEKNTAVNSYNLLITLRLWNELQDYPIKYITNSTELFSSIGGTVFVEEIFMASTACIIILFGRRIGSGKKWTNF